MATDSSEFDAIFKNLQSIFVGNQGDDVFTGGYSTDYFNGLGGDDVFVGNGGGDGLDGGSGFNFAVYSTASSGITADLLTPTNNTGAAQSDVYDGTIQGLRGTSDVDFLYGDNNNNQLEGGPGGDTLDGRLGFDYASYAHASGPVRANLGNQTSNLGEAAGDTYISIEGLRGSDYDDTLIGNNGNNFLAGGPGADYLTGNGGLDTADYYFATSTVFANLGNPASNTGEATGDTYFSIEVARQQLRRHAARRRQ